MLQTLGERLRRNGFDIVSTVILVGMLIVTAGVGVALVAIVNVCLAAVADLVGLGRCTP